MDASIRPVNRPPQAARESYNRLSRWYDALAGRSERPHRDRGLEQFSAGAGESVLEIGFGTGHALLSLARAVGPDGRVVGVDISDGMLARSRQRLAAAGLEARVDLHRGDAADLSFLEAGGLHGVFMSFALELFDTPEIPRVLAECHRVLRPGGRVTLVCMTKGDPPGLAVRLYEWFHDRLPDYADCRPIFPRPALEQAGFGVRQGSLASMWGLPVEVVSGLKP